MPANRERMILCAFLHNCGAHPGGWRHAGAQPERLQDLSFYQEIAATALEFRILELLVERRGRVQSRERLLADAWREDDEVSERAIDTHIKRLRDKLGAAGPLLETVRGVGYRLSDAHAVVANRE